MMINNTPTISPEPKGLPRLALIAAAVLAYLLLWAVGSLLGGEVQQIALASLNALPFAGLAALAYLSSRNFDWAWFAGGAWLLMLLGGAALITMGFSLTTMIGAITPDAPPPPLAAADLLRVALIALGIVAAVAISLLALLPPARRLAARLIPIDPDSYIHALALATVVGVGLICTVPLLVLGSPPLLALVDQLGAEALGRDEAGMLRDQLYTLAWIIPAAVLAVGFGSRRTLPEALARLGLVRPTLRQVGAAVGIALLLAVAMQALGVGLGWLLGSLGLPQTDMEAFGELLSFAINPIGAVVIGVTAGLGEELAVRGVLQPRLGLILSNLFFVSLHALQYSWDALLVVFLVGVVCGIVRNRTNTSTAAIVHGVYNFTLIIWAIVG